MSLPDKKLYTYKKALNQPYWLQRFNEEFSLNSPIKFSRVVYFAIVSFLMYFGFFKLMLFLPFGLRLVASIFIGAILSDYLANLIIDDKPIVFYVKDFIAYYFKYGYRASRIYINKGQVYYKPKPILKRKEKVPIENRK